MSVTTPGLFDLQVNGYAGVDFNASGLTPDALDHALAAMLKAGVTGCLPTIITAHRHELFERFAALDNAVANSRLGPSMVPGYHLEGPFLRAEPGYAGCHPPEAMGDPDVPMVLSLSGSLTRPILMVTLAPERAGALLAINQLRAAGMTLCVAHSAAGFAQIDAAVEAGLTVSTHLGNGLPQQLPKLDNTLLAQLAAPGLFGCFIADGHHISRDALRALIALKGIERSVLVSDAVLAAAAPAGIYSFAGMSVERDAAGVVRVPGQANLAGSALEMDQAVRNVVAWGIASFEQAITMGAHNPRAILGEGARHQGITLPVGETTWDQDLTVIRCNP